MDFGYPMRWVLTAEAALLGLLLAALPTTIIARIRWRWLQLLGALIATLPALAVAVVLIEALCTERYFL